MRTTYALWLEGARPKTLIATVAPVAIGTALAFGEKGWNPLTFFATLLCALLIQIGTNFANDYLDYVKGSDKEDRCGPRRLAQSQLISVSSLKKATLFTFIGAALLGLYLTMIGGYGIALLTLIAISCGFLYTAGPYSLAYLGLGDLFVFIFFGPIATAGTVYLQLHTLSPLAILAGIAPGLLSTALLTANNLRDLESDRRALKKTLPVRFGKKVGKIEYLFCLFGAALTPFALVFYTGGHFFALSSAFFLLFTRKALTLLLKKETEEELAPLLEKTAKLLALYTFIFVVTWPLSP